MIEFESEYVNTLTANKTYITIPDSNEKTVVLQCGSQSVEIPWRTLFALAMWSARKFKDEKVVE